MSGISGITPKNTRTDRLHDRKYTRKAEILRYHGRNIEVQMTRRSPRRDEARTGSSHRYAAHGDETAVRDRLLSPAP
jgi:hypothetical protein